MTFVFQHFCCVLIFCTHSLRCSCLTVWAFFLKEGDVYKRQVVGVARDDGMSIRELVGVQRVELLGCGMARSEVGIVTD